MVSLKKSLLDKRWVSLNLVLVVFLVFFISGISGTLISCRLTNPELLVATDNTTGNPGGLQISTKLPQGLIPEEERDLAPLFNLPYALDGEFALSDLEGNLVMLDFTATWCYWCDVQAPQVEQIHKKYKDKGLSVIAVNVREAKEVVLQKYPDGTKGYPIALDIQGDVLFLYGVEGFPTYILLDRHSRIAFMQSGYDEHFEKKLSRILDYMLEHEKKS